MFQNIMIRIVVDCLFLQFFRLCTLKSQGSIITNNTLLLMPSPVAYLETSQTSAMDLYSKSNLRLKGVN